MEIQVGIAKVGKYAVQDSGDSVEVVERPNGGLSIIIVDGQGHGRAAKRISHQVARKAASLIGDGSRDGVVMRSISDYLYALRDGSVSATVTIITADLAANTLIVSRNSNTPVIINHQDGSSCISSGVNPIGVHRINRPSVSQWPLYPDTTIIGFTDGVVNAGRGFNETGFSLEYITDILSLDTPDPQWLANHLLEHVISLAQGRPEDDMAIAVLGIRDIDNTLGKRSLAVKYPF